MRRHSNRYLGQVEKSRNQDKERVIGPSFKYGRDGSITRIERRTIPTSEYVQMM
jgi:hypothetical protein